MDDESCPVNFNLVEEPARYVRCKFCLCKRSLFVCTKCVQNGHFVHSSSFLKERFVEKQIRMENVKKALQVLNEKAELFLVKKRQLETLNFNIDDRTRKIGWLTQMIKEQAQQIKKEKEQVEALTAANLKLRTVLPKYEDKVRKLEEYLLSKKDEVDAYRKKLEDTLGTLQSETRVHLQNLVKYIFPIRHVLDGHDTEGHIAEASRTVLVRGKWLTPATDEGNFLIVAPYLPADGDYNIYNDWVLTNRGETSLPSSVTHENLISSSAHRICAALTYTCQLVEICAAYLSIKLPYKVNYCDFCRIDLPEQKFNIKVARLNANILHLCYTQNVDLKVLDPSRTLENMHRLLVGGMAPELGRRGAVDRNNCLEDETDRKLALQLHPSGFDIDTDDEGSEESQLAHEWESIPQTNALDMLPQANIPTQSPNLMSSFTSLFRWGNR